MKIIEKCQRPEKQVDLNIRLERATDYKLRNRILLRFA